MTLNTGHTADAGAAQRASTSVPLASRHARLNKRKQKKLGLGRFARTAATASLVLDPALEPQAIAAARRCILNTIDQLGLVAAGVFQGHRAELVLQQRRGALDAGTLSTIRSMVHASRGVILVETVFHDDAWADDAGCRHRPTGTYAIPRVRALFRRAVACSRTLKDTTLIIPKG